MASSNELPAPTVIRTTHNEEGKAIISKAVPEQPTPQVVSNGDAKFYLAYATSQFPVDMNKDKDLDAYQEFASQPPGLVVNNGTVLRHVDMAPGITSPMHRTVSMDYGIVIAGDIELILDSGEARRMGAGDICDQRGTMHAWRNLSQTSYARMLYVLQPSQPLKIGEQTLGEDYGGTMDGVRSST
ncbi:Putative rmlC-like cupin domain superfamily, rmlC-like jelly roll protein [Septoria linicola]|uniref:RmlC-like cupin domain superfamily, rmlC-like jelly roll protein n=1 Tax=Septoria linicola TaxID=215465 RepID=A0A9Q9B8V7_9PEZI|nr:Putative rmlC-like cupin domain superfamily, rmlC-like jelly roll protein [Septoria linicola]